MPTPAFNELAKPLAFKKYSKLPLPSKYFCIPISKRGNPTLNLLAIHASITNLMAPIGKKGPRPLSYSLHQMRSCRSILHRDHTHTHHRQTAIERDWMKLTSMCWRLMYSLSMDVCAAPQPRPWARHPSSQLTSGHRRPASCLLFLIQIPYGSCPRERETAHGRCDPKKIGSLGRVIVSSPAASW